MPRTVDIDERRQELTDAAARLIARAGIGAATMREVAAEAGLTTGALTHYFADKRMLLQATLEASLEQRIAMRGTGRDSDPQVALRAALVGALPIDAASRRHWMVTIAFCGEAAGDAELASTQRKAYRDYRRHVSRLVERCGESRAGALEVAETLIAAADGVALQALFDPESWPPERQIAALDRALGMRCTVGTATTRDG